MVNQAGTVLTALHVVDDATAIQLTFADGWAGGSRLHADGVDETWPAWDPGPALIESFEAQVVRWRERAKGPEVRPTWQDETRAAELIARQRPSTGNLGTHVTSRTRVLRALWAGATRHNPAYSLLNVMDSMDGRYCCPSIKLLLCISGTARSL